jgi:hypothetical protein
MTIACVERLAITDSGCNALAFHYVRHSWHEVTPANRGEYIF